MTTPDRLADSMGKELLRCNIVQTVRSCVAQRSTRSVEATSQAAGRRNDHAKVAETSFLWKLNVCKFILFDVVVSPTIHRYSVGHACEVRCMNNDVRIESHLQRLSPDRQGVTP